MIDELHDAESYQVEQRCGSSANYANVLSATHEKNSLQLSIF